MESEKEKALDSKNQELFEYRIKIPLSEKIGLAFWIAVSIQLMKGFMILGRILWLLMLMKKTKSTPQFRAPLVERKQ